MSSITIQKGSSFNLNKLSLQIVKDNIKAADIIHRGSTPFINLKKKLMKPKGPEIHIAQDKQFKVQKMTP